MAGLTTRGCVDMASTFTACSNTVMARHAIFNDALVIETCGGQPSLGRMTTAAFGVREQMSGGFARRDRAVMTTRAGAQHFIMIDAFHRRPFGGVMASFTAITGIDVTGRFSSGIHAVMALDAIADNACMVKYSRNPRDGDVATITGKLRRDMVG